ncbi:COMPASS component Swd3p [[Candida] anglica]
MVDISEEKSVDGCPYKFKAKFLPSSSPSTNSIRFSPDGRIIATCSSDGIVRIYDADTYKLQTELKGHTRGVSSIEFSPIDSNILVSCSDDLTIRLWSIKKSKCIRILQKHTYHITTIKFSSKGNVLVSGSADETITIWDITTGKPLKTLAAHSDPVSSISLTPDNSIIVSASYDGLMRLFDTESGQCLKTLTYNSSSHGTATASTNDVVNFPISNVECSPNGKFILSSSLDGTLRLWNYMDNKVVKTYVDTIPVSENYNCGAKFITKSKSSMIASGSEKSGVLIWDVQSKKIVGRLGDGETESSPVLDVDVYDEGRLLVSCSKDGWVRVWELS